MAVNTTQLQTDLSAYGTIIFCDINNPSSYLVVMEGVIEGDYAAIENIINTAMGSDFPVEFNCELNSGVLKCERSV